MVGVALPSIGSSLHLSTTSLQWVVSGYVLGYGGLLLLGGRAADLLGRKRVFLAAGSLFWIAPLLRAAPSGPPPLGGPPPGEGAAAAVTAPPGPSVLTPTVAPRP